MCTAIQMNTKDSYFGRTLDIDRSYGEEVCVMPRNYLLNFRQKGDMPSHYAIIGMATVAEGIPLYYDGVNEHGLAIAGLNFPHNAYYGDVCNDKDNIAPFEFIPWILCQCKTIDEAKVLLDKINLADIPFSKSLPTAPLHWMLTDGRKSIVAEQMKNGLRVYDNPVGVLTNNPPFEQQLLNLKKYQYLAVDNKGVASDEEADYSSYSQGLGGVGLPGDVSSMSRFARAAFGLKNSVCNENELSSVGQFFHLLSSVEMVRGVCVTDGGSLDMTVYSGCMNINKGFYYYTTYDNHQITCVDMHKTDLNAKEITAFRLEQKQRIFYQNQK